MAALKAQPGKDLIVLGSGELVRSLRRRDLVDEYLLLIHPLVLGSGRRLFADGGAGGHACGWSTPCRPPPACIIATYRPAGR